MKNTIHLGDTVSGNYHGVDFTGIVHAYDGSGYMYVKPIGDLIVYGVARDGIAICPDTDESDSIRFVSRPEVAPTVVQASYAAMGGAYIKA